jgi:hypothetical protein
MAAVENSGFDSRAFDRVVGRMPKREVVQSQLKL